MVLIPLALSMPKGFDAFHWLTLGLRLSFILLIYWFLYHVARVSVRELNALGAVTSGGEARGSVSALPRPSAALELVEPADASYYVGTSFPLDAYTTIGRNDGNTIVLDDGFVSGSHAEITFDRGQWWLQDLNSTNGTTINRQAVHHRVPVQDGDYVGFGRVQFVAHL